MICSQSALYESVLTFYSFNVALDWFDGSANSSAMVAHAVAVVEMN